MDSRDSGNSVHYFLIRKLHINTILTPAVSTLFVGASNELGEFESGVMARLLGRCS